MVTAEQLHGTWHLRSWRSESDDGQVAFPMGRDARGVIHYQPDGRMSVLIAAADREPFATDDVLAGADAEKRSAFETFVAYAGRYTLHGDHVVHHVELSLFPNWEGSRQKRYARVVGDVLELSTDALAQRGRVGRAILEWERRREA